MSPVTHWVGDAPTSLHALLRTHSPVNVARRPAEMEPSGIQCLCDWVWRAPSTYASHVAGAVFDAGYEPTDPEMLCPGCDCEPVGYAPHNGKGDCPPRSTEPETCRYCGRPESEHPGGVYCPAPRLTEGES